MGLRLQEYTEIVSISLAEDYLLLKVFNHDLTALASLPIKPIRHLPVFLPAFAYLDEANRTHQGF
jgi:hypothetical protein